MDKHPLGILVEIFGGRVGKNTKGKEAWYFCFDEYLYECDVQDDPRGRFFATRSEARDKPYQWKDCNDIGEVVRFFAEWAREDAEIIELCKKYGFRERRVRHLEG